jgi:hypothetical protein
MADVEAIRNTLFEDPDEIALYTNNLRLALATGKQMVDESPRSYDDLMVEMVESQQYKN